MPVGLIALTGSNQGMDENTRGRMQLETGERNDETGEWLRGMGERLRQKSIVAGQAGPCGAFDRFGVSQCQPWQTIAGGADIS